MAQTLLIRRPGRLLSNMNTELSISATIRPEFYGVGESPDSVRRRTAPPPRAARRQSPRRRALTVRRTAPQEALRSEVRTSSPSANSARQDELIRLYSPLVRQIAGGFQRKLPRNVLRDDLLAAGMSGLWDAIRKHGDDQNTNFDWYVRVRIRGAILDELRAQDWLPRRARAAAEATAGTPRECASPVVLRFDEISDTEQARCLAAGDRFNTELMVERRFVKQSLEKAVNLLPDRERRIVFLHYFKGVKFKELGEMLGVSEPRISQLHSRAMGRLRTLLGDQAA